MITNLRNFLAHNGIISSLKEASEISKETNPDLIGNVIITGLYNVKDFLILLGSSTSPAYPPEKRPSVVNGYLPFFPHYDKVTILTLWIFMNFIQSFWVTNIETLFF